MPRTIEDLLLKLSQLRKIYSNNANIRRIGLGLKESSGRIANEIAFRFYVEEKLPLGRIIDKNIIPSKVYGTSTDIIEIGNIQPLTSVSSAGPVNQDRYRSSGIRGGVCIRNEHFENNHPSGYGTLGILARRIADDKLVGITCSHVANNASDTPTTLDTQIGQPKYWTSCCCCPVGLIGVLKAATLNSDLDCALIEIDDDIKEHVDDNTTENKIVDFANDITGAALPLLDATVRKYGQATGLTQGKVVDIAFGVDQMLIELEGGNPGDSFAHHGDSGAMVVNDDDQVIGMLVAAWQDPQVTVNLGVSTRPGLTKGIATYIKPIMEELDITIAGMDASQVTFPVQTKPWPGGQADTILNPVEKFASADFDLIGNVDWDVSTGGAGATIIESGGQTAIGLSNISVRYDNVSPSGNKSDSVIIKATKGTDEKTKLRTIAKITPRINTNVGLDAANDLRFMNGSGTDNQAGIGTPGTDGATQFRAKAEIIFDIEPTGIQWDANGVTEFEVGSPAGSGGKIVARRQTKYNKGRQANADPNRTHTEELDWISAGDSTATDFQEASTAKPDMVFRLANEGFDPSGLKQGYDRSDFRDYMEMHDGTNWLRITPYLEWHANLTADLDPGGGAATVGAVNNADAGVNVEAIPNEPPVVTLPSTHREHRFGETVTLVADSTDPNNDNVTYEWEQLNGPDLGWTDSKQAGNNVTFPAPNDDFFYEFKVVGDDGTGGLARTAGNHLSTAEVKMTVSVIEWENIGGGDPVAARNMEETYNAADFGIGAGALNWDVTQGTVDAQIIEVDGVAVAPTGTHNGATIIKVRYPNVSGDLTRNQSVKIKATHTGSGKSWFKRRTVFRVTVTVHPNDTRTHLIPSTLGNVGKDHFCTVKNASSMIFRAVLNPAPPDAQITWDATGRAITSPSVGGDRKTAHINRNPAAGLRIPLKIQVAGDDVYEGLGWIIWVTSSAAAVNIPSPVPIGGTSTPVSGGYDFTFTIIPATMVVANPTTVDIPDLTGINTTDPPDVTVGDVGVYQTGFDLSDGANLKWDVSRRMKQKIINPNGIPFDTNGNHTPRFYQNFLNYPSSDIVGNDDAHDTDETNNPYTGGGRITSTDTPTSAPQHVEGNLGDTFDLRDHFGEFARVELDGNWYRISDYHDWRIHFIFEKILDGAGNEVWSDDGSLIEENNNGF